MLGAAICPITIPLFEEHSFYVYPVGYPMVFAVGLIAVLANVSAVERILAIGKKVDAREALRISQQQAHNESIEEEGSTAPQELTSSFFIN